MFKKYSGWIEKIYNTKRYDFDDLKRSKIFTQKFKIKKKQKPQYT